MTILEKLNKIQTELKVPKNQFNDFGKYKYRSCEDILEAVKPFLKKLELILVVYDELICVGNKNYIKASAQLEDFEEKKIISVAYAREAEIKKGMDDSQITGTASSYARKYALNGLFLIDDTKDADSQEPAKSVAPQNNIKKLKKKLQGLGAKNAEEANTILKGVGFDEKIETITEEQAEHIIEFI